MLFLGIDEISTIIAFLLTATLAFAYHEFAHAIVADRMGDDTPRAYGRITLNPFVHLDLFGMLMLVLAGFGWATTPVNPHNLRGNPRQSFAIVAAAGPAANFMMAVLWALPIRLGVVGQAFAAQSAGFTLPTAFQVCFWGTWINLLLMVFNLMPIPPLDGFTILRGILPPEMAYRLEPLRQYGTLILIAVIFILPSIGVPVFSWILTPVTEVFMPLLLG